MVKNLILYNLKVQNHNSKKEYRGKMCQIGVALFKWSIEMNITVLRIS